MKILEHGMKAVERVLQKMLCRIVSVDEMHFLCLRVELLILCLSREGYMKSIMLKEKSLICVLWT